MNYKVGKQSKPKNLNIINLIQKNIYYIKNIDLLYKYKYGSFCILYIKSTL